jgi:hypothetical protein
MLAKVLFGFAFIPLKQRFHCGASWAIGYRNCCNFTMRSIFCSFNLRHGLSAGERGGCGAGGGGVEEGGAHDMAGMKTVRLNSQAQPRRAHERAAFTSDAVFRARGDAGAQRRRVGWSAVIASAL